MQIKTFDNVEQIHKIWNDETWIRYSTILTEMGLVDLTPEQKKVLFPKVPDYFIINDKVYKPEVVSHLEKYWRQVDSSSFYRIDLQEIIEPNIINEVNKELRKTKPLTWTRATLGFVFYSD